MELARQGISVLAVFALLGAMLWILRNRGWATVRAFGGKARARQFESVERLALTANHSLHLVRIGEKEVVVATHPQGCVLLAELPANGGTR